VNKNLASAVFKGTSIIYKLPILGFPC